MARKRNLLIFLPDQLRADMLRSYGGNVHAPNLDKLAFESFVFERAYVTQPICTPSRSSLMTGTWPHANGCTRNFLILDPKWRCLPELVGDLDYQCGYIGKWHLGDELFAQRGFSEWVSVESNPRYQKLVSPGRDPSIVSDYSNFLFERGVRPRAGRDYFDNRLAADLPVELSKARFLEGKACEFLRQHRADPFILVVAFFEPHSPYNGPLNNEHAFDEVEVDATVNHHFGANMPLRYRLRQERDRERYGNPPERYREAKRNYYGLVTLIDRSIGAILVELNRLGLSENTIVIHTSDHGDMMTAHGLMRKEVMFEESIRVPFLIRLPEQRRLQRVEQPVSHIDFVPTILDLLEKPPRGQCAGQSLVPVLRGEAKSAQNVIVQWSPGKTPKIQKRTRLSRSGQIELALNESTRAVISADGWKLCLRDKDKNELYNLRVDSCELYNLFGRAEYKPIVDKLTAEIRQWQKETGDTIEL
jgi:arylsulfatase A-like enzyme